MIFFEKKPVVHENIFDCLIVGSGAAGYNAAVHLHEKGCRNFAIITENRLAGTSRNTGSDKQTYYKIACAGEQSDSPMSMAKTLFAGGSMDGDIALCEASHSLQEFFHLVSIGVEFPHNRYGEFAGYKTDHDPLQRASSIGPYTSKKMTEQLEQAVNNRNIPLLDKTRIIKILTTNTNQRSEGHRSQDLRSYGLLCIQNEKDFIVYFCRNIIFATGGPPGLYGITVYPPSHFGSSGILAREGVVFSNITEWQYGIGSTKFRWNLSGSFQQVIPRYVSVDENGREEEFLSAYFSSMKIQGRAVFLKGYQWPFDPAKIAGEGSSLVDMAIYVEKHIKGKRIFLDFTRNPQGFVLDEIDETAYEYLKNSDALCPTPLERLLRLNPLSYDLYKSNGIDLAKELLEIDVLPQHNNGGAEINSWWETSIKHLFVAGECAGTHGVHRPGGSALNSGQVGGLRAASFIAGHYLKEDSFYEIETLKAMAAQALEDFQKELTPVTETASQKPVTDLLNRLQKMNAKTAKFIRSRRELEKSLEELNTLAKEKANPAENLPAFFLFKETLLLSRLLYDGILSYINDDGKSRGSYLIVDSLEDIKTCLSGVEIDVKHKDKIINTVYIPEEDKVVSSQRQVRPIPDSNTWFEKIWREYREGTVFSD